MRKLVLLAAASCGGLFISAPAFAHPVDNRVEISTPTRSAVVTPASDPVPRATEMVLTTVVADPPLPQVTVVAGDTLWGIGVRTLRTWQQLAAFNHVVNPNLIYVGDVETIPPADYVAGSVSVPTPPPAAAPVLHVSAPAPTRAVPPTRTTAPVARSSGAPGSYQACVAMRESGNGSGSSNIYGFLQTTWNSLGLSGSPGSASRATQDAAFARLYALDGKAPWSPYDHC